MLKVYCDFCGNEIELTGNLDDCSKFLKILVRKVKGKDLQIRFQVEVQKSNHICEQCAIKAIKAVLK